ncbi:MAG: ATP-binding protein [Thermoplasmata archaeon]
MSILQNKDKKVLTAQDLIDDKYVPQTAKEALGTNILSIYNRYRTSGFSKEESLAKLFPDVVLSEEVLESIVTGILSGNHLLFFGPPGSGKTLVAKSIWKLFPKEVHAVADCPVQDDPMSLVDEKFWKIAPPCPFCKNKYGNAEGIDFHPDLVDPENVPVKKITLKEGLGFARIQGSSEVFPDHLTGQINLHKLEKVGDPNNPLVLEPGKLLQANRGILVIDEIGKLPYGTQNVMLQALEEGIVTPSKSRETFPAMFFAVTTSNIEDLDNINQPLIDRFSNIYIDFPQVHYMNMSIINVNILNRKTRNGPMLIKEISSLVVEDWRKKYSTHPELEEICSNRTLSDIVDRVISYSIINNGGLLPDRKNIYEGVMDALKTRIRARSIMSYNESVQTLEQYLKNNMENIIAIAAKRVWCDYFTNSLKSNKEEGDSTIAEVNRIVNDTTLQDEIKKSKDKFPRIRALGEYLKNMDHLDIDPAFYGIWFAKYIKGLEEKCD